MKRRLFAAVSLSSGLFLISRPALAHHGFAGRYNEENPVTVTGTVIELQFMNPHSSIIFEVKDANGNPVLDCLPRGWKGSRLSSTRMVMRFSPTRQYGAMSNEKGTWPPKLLPTSSPLTQTVQE